VGAPEAPLDFLAPLVAAAAEVLVLLLLLLFYQEELPLGLLGVLEYI
jgi:hypothetical protein